MPLESLNEYLNEEQRQKVSALTSPIKIQQFLDSVKYPGEDRNRCPVNVIRDSTAHCLDGALFAAAILRRIGYPPIIVDLYPDPGMDDDHVLALYRVKGFWGAVAKSNFIGLRFREPVYRSLRELVMSYFDVFYNVDGLRTLRSYSRMVNLKRFDRSGWETNDSGVDQIEEYLKHLPSTRIITEDQASCLNPLDRDSYRAGMLIANPDGLYKPGK